MKKKFFNIKYIILLFINIIISCTAENQNEPKPLFFLNEIRPVFFKHLDYNSPEMVSKIPSFLSNFKETYFKLKAEYDKGLFISESDLDNMRLSGMYFSFGLTATTRAYLDGFIEFEDIIGDNKVGLFSQLPVATENFKQLELEAMMKTSQEVAFFAMNVNGFNDKTYGTFLVSRQISERVKSDTNFNNRTIQDSVINYIDSRIYDFDLFSEWNVLMSQLSFTNYADSLNTFKNPRMNIVLSNLNNRLIIGTIPDLNGRYAEILGPMFRFDSNMKKLDWIINDDGIENINQIDSLKSYIDTLEEIRNYILNDKELLFNDWEYKTTLLERYDKLEEIKNYTNSLLNNPNQQNNLELESFFKTKNFLQAYQCYNCHKPVDLK